MLLEVAPDVAGGDALEGFPFGGAPCEEPPDRTVVRYPSVLVGQGSIEEVGPGGLGGRSGVDDERGRPVVIAAYNGGLAGSGRVVLVGSWKIFYHSDSDNHVLLQNAVRWLGADPPA